MILYQNFCIKLIVLARKSMDTKKRLATPSVFCKFSGWKMGLERRSRSEDTFENKYLFILATHKTTLLLQTKAERRRRSF